MCHADHQELTDLVTHLGRWLDDKRFDDPSAVFTVDATVRTPGGVAHGRDALAAQARRSHPANVPTQHFITDPIIEVDGDQAVISANLLVVFARQDGTRLLGERYRLGAARTPQGWRLCRVEADPIWEVMHA